MEVPQDIAFEIFSWLPAKSICKFTSTCTSIYNFSKETFFKTKQARNLLGADDSCFFIQPDQVSQRYEKRVELLSLPMEQPSSGVPYDALTFLSNSASVLASSNGLLLCHTIDSIELFICNPITKSCLFIPTPESLQKSRNFCSINLMLDCSHGSADDYYVFLLETTLDWWPTCYTCNVYHGKEGVWKTMEHNFYTGERAMEFDMPVFHRGALHFISDSTPYIVKSSSFYKPYIMSYNLENGNSEMLKLPKEAIKDCHDCNMGIFNWGKVSSSNQSICLVKLKKFAFTVWCLRDYKSGTWQKVLKKRVKALGLKEKYPHVTGFMVMNGHLLVFATEENVYSCDLGDEKCMMVEEVGQHNCGLHPRFIPYSGTLRSCGTNANSRALRSCGTNARDMHC
ncbi:uncharacterized protein LOC131649070 [Vicia villosa]|uniref:uncharacterized protein LOC131649070 n=1 Tax=Vicia villosa TaxID=3911 RepID=UPI00273C5FF4|nr:uncharacterized protein LOC131649070 [Vicia villosa]